MVSTRSIYRALLLASLAACTEPAGDDAFVQLSFEAIPGVGVALPQGAIDASGSTYADKLVFTTDVSRTIVPAIMDGFGVAPMDVDTVLAPGGFLLETNPSMQARIPIDHPEDATATADHLAAALGYAMFQWSVLVTDFSALDGDTGYLAVGFPGSDLTPDMAQRFFEHAATIDQGLGGGYMAYGDDMIFLNVRDDAGQPYSGLDDQSFFAALEQAAASFTPTEVAFLESGFADAHFVGNDWDAMPAGQDYLATLGPGTEEWLNPVQLSFAEMADDAATEYDWAVLPQALRGPTLEMQSGHWRALMAVGDTPAALAR